MLRFPKTAKAWYNIVKTKRTCVDDNKIARKQIAYYSKTAKSIFWRQTLFLISLLSFSFILFFFSKYRHCHFKATYLHEVYCIIILRVCYPVLVGMTTNCLAVNCRQIVFSLNCFLNSYRPIYIANISNVCLV
jgi:hypothetical protein